MLWQDCLHSSLAEKHILPGRRGFFPPIRSCDPIDCRPPGSSVYGIFEQDYWIGLPFPSPGDLPDPGIKSWSPIFYHLSHQGSCPTHETRVLMLSLFPPISVHSFSELLTRPSLFTLEEIAFYQTKQTKQEKSYKCLSRSGTTSLSTWSYRTNTPAPSHLSIHWAHVSTYYIPGIIFGHGDSVIWDPWLVLVYDLQG